MSALALTMVLGAALLHALWNLAAKRVSSGLPFVIATNLVIAPLYVPVIAVLLLWRQPHVPWSELWVVVVSSMLKLGYALVLQHAYRKGDFSLVYPLARGTGPLLAVAAAMLFLGERPGTWALTGAALIIGGIYLLTGGHRLLRADHAHLLGAVKFGVLTGVFIASYSVWDAHAVAGRGIPPLLFDAGTGWVMLVVLSPLVWRRWPEVAEVWRKHRREVLIVSFLSPVAYVLVLTAVTFTPLTHVAPVREVSMLFGTLLGAHVLREADLRRRLGAAAAMAAGVILIAAQ